MPALETPEQIAQFMALVDQSTPPHQVWRGTVNRDGATVFRLRGRGHNYLRAQVLTWELAGNKRPSQGHVLVKRCDVPLCISPSCWEMMAKTTSPPRSNRRWIELTNHERQGFERSFMNGAYIPELQLKYGLNADEAVREARRLIDDEQRWGARA